VYLQEMFVKREIGLAGASETISSTDLLGAEALQVIPA